MSDTRDPFERVMEDAEALHETVLDGLPPDLQNTADDVLQSILERAKARPLMALLVAAAIGFLIASATSK